MYSGRRELFQIEYKSKLYPYVILTIDGNTIQVSTVDLEKQLIDSNCNPVDNDAKVIDNLFAYYVDTEHELQLSEDVFTSIIYG